MTSSSAAASIRNMPQSFWIANVMEIFERMAWYGFYALSSIYMCDAVVDGGLGFSSGDRGIMQGVVTFLIYLFPFVTGALGDRYGYKKMLLVSFSILVPAYLLLGLSKTLPTFFAAFLFVGIGASIFKPLIVGTVGRLSNEKTGSLAFGIFYMMVNIGGFLGPLLATMLRAQSWSYVFYASAIWIFINIPILLFFYKDPESENEVENRAKPFKQVMHEMFEVIGNERFFLMFFVTLVVFVIGTKWYKLEYVALFAAVWVALNVFFDGFLGLVDKKHWRMKLGNKRFLAFLLLLSSFWIAFNQLFITLPLYMQDYIDSRPVMDFIFNLGASFGMDTSPTGWLATLFLDKSGGVRPEHFTNINAFFIIFFQIAVSFMNRKIKPLIAIMIGIMLTGISFLLIGATISPWFIAIGVMIFSFGEMMASPRAKEYTSHSVAPRDKQGLYMGYFMWSNAIGSLFGGLLSGVLYQRIALDMGNPQLMWTVFACFSFACCILIMVYHIKIGRKVAAAS